MKKKVNFSVGDIVAVTSQIREGDRTKTSIFEGIVIGFSGRGENRTFCVRRIGAQGVGVEQIWPVFSPQIKVKVKKKGRARRAKLYYLRRVTRKKATKILRRQEPKTPVPEDEKK